MEIVHAMMAHVEALERKSNELERTLAEKNLLIAQLLSKSPPSSSSTTTAFPPQLIRDKHVEFLTRLMDKKDAGDSLEYVMTEHLRIQGVFWALGAMDLLDQDISSSKREELILFTLSCLDKKRGGFGGNVGHDAHILYTQHAIYVLAQLRALDRLTFDQRQGVIDYVSSLQLANGSYQGDEWGEVDTRFTFCAVVTLAVLSVKKQPNCQDTIAYLLSTRNELDGGFGCNKDVESHAGYVYTALASLAVLGGLTNEEGEWDSLAWWLAERQCDSGGLNGRPEKLADVCYSWWVLASLSMLNRLSWIDQEKLQDFIVACQDVEFGGIGDHPGHVGDVYHTFFGLCGLGLLGRGGGRKVDPVFALPVTICQELELVHHHQQEQTE